MLSRTDHRGTQNLAFSNSIKQNLSIIHADLQNSLKKLNPIQLDESSCSQTHLQDANFQQQKLIKQNINLLRSLFQLWQKDQIKSMLMYNKILKKCKIFQYDSNLIFANTQFNQKIWPIMTYYLQRQLKYNKIRTDNSRIIDVWYQYIANQQKTLFQKILSQDLLQGTNLGEWFKTQCLELLFQNYYGNNKKAFTDFFVNFSLYGLSFLFIQSIQFLRRICTLQITQSRFTNNRKITQINYIHSSYIEKFNIQAKQ